MRFAVGALYWHRSCLDMALEVLKVQYIGKASCKLRVNYVSRRNPSLVYWGPATVKIKFDQIHNWSRL